MAPYQNIPTPAKSPDFNPIEHVWARAKIKVNFDGIYANNDDLWLAIAESWNEMRENTRFVLNLVNSMPMRLYSAIEVNGSHTKY